MPSAASFLVLAFAGCSCNAPAAGPSPPAEPPANVVTAPHPADAALATLAAAFDRKDATAARAGLHDAWSGSRFWSGWTSEQWHAAALALRGATLKSATDRERIYTLTDEGKPKDVVMTWSDDAWKLDYNGFKGPFPHE